MSDQSERVLDIFEQYVCPVCTEESDDYIFCEDEETDLCPQCYRAKHPELKGE